MLDNEKSNYITPSLVITMVMLKDEKLLAASQFKLHKV